MPFKKLRLVGPSPYRTLLRTVRVEVCWWKPLYSEWGFDGRWPHGDTTGWFVLDLGRLSIIIDL